MASKKPACFYCSISFGTHEERVEFEGKLFHPDCNKRRERKERIKAWFRIGDGQRTILVIPKHRFGR